MPWAQRRRQGISPLVLGLGFALLLGLSQARAQTASEYALKAVYFQTFGRYVTWPDSLTHLESDAPFVIGVLGNNPFNDTLEKLYAKNTIQGRRVEIRYLETLENDILHVLFISRSQRHQVSRIIEKTKNRPILTVADFDGAAKFGVHVNFYVTGGSNLKFEINQSAVETAGLKMSFHLLQYARIVED